MELCLALCLHACVCMRVMQERVCVCVCVCRVTQLRRRLRSARKALLSPAFNFFISLSFVCANFTLTNFSYPIFLLSGPVCKPCGGERKRRQVCDRAETAALRHCERSAAAATAKDPSSPNRYDSTQTESKLPRYTFLYCFYCFYCLLVCLSI